MAHKKQDARQRRDGAAGQAPARSAGTNMWDEDLGPRMQLHYGEHISGAALRDTIGFPFG